MADAVITVPLHGAPHQVTIAAASSGNATASSLLLVVVNGTTNRQLINSLRMALEAARRDANVFTG